VTGIDFDQNEARKSNSLIDNDDIQAPDGHLTNNEGRLPHE
jgi:hypothetical protein